MLAQKSEDYTCDKVYGERLKLFQPKKGFRICIDTIFLAAAVKADPGDQVLDIGAGVGGSALCLAHRCPEVMVHGIELQRENVLLASQNIIENNMRGRVEILHGDLMKPPPRLPAGNYTHVMTNPPFFDGDGYRPSPYAHKQLSHHTKISFESWFKFSLLMVRSGGSFTMIYPANLLHKVMSSISDKLGDITIFPLWPKVGEAAKRVIISGVKGSNGPTQLLPGIVLHQPNGLYTLDADRILRQGEAIRF